MITKKDILEAVKQMEVNCAPKPYKAIFVSDDEKIAVKTLKEISCVIFITDGYGGKVVRHWYKGKQLTDAEVRRLWGVRANE
jgi:hypothetical protein